MEYFNRYSPEYIAALKTGNGHYKIRLEILSQNETAVGEITKDISLTAQGQITINYEQITRRSCSLTLIDVDGKYLPHKNSPFWINRKFKLLIGLVVGDDIYWWSQGIFYTLSVTANNHILSIEGVDKGAALDGTLKLNMTDAEYVIEREDNISRTIRQLMALNVGASSIEGLNEIIYGGDAPMDVKEPLVGIRYFGQQAQSKIVVDANNYVGEIFTKLADLYGADCYYDTEGYFNFVPYMDNYGYNYAPKQWEFNDLSAFFEDVNYNYSYDGENVVTYYTNSTDIGVANVAWTSYNTNPLSPLNVSVGIRRAQSQEMPYYNYAGDTEVDICTADLIQIQKEIQELGINTSVTVYGNIDTNNREVLEWTEENIELYYDELLSWGEENPEDLLGSISTVMGVSSEYDGVEIAYSPLLQTTNGAVLLSSELVDEYIWGLLDNLSENWTKEQLLAADVTGLEFDGVMIKKLIADAGETAILTGEAMHYVGQYGALALAQNALKEATHERDELNQEQMIQDCKAAANHYLTKSSLIGMQLTFNAPLIPHMDVNRTIGICDSWAGIEDGTFIVQSITIPLSAGKMSISATNINWLPNDMGFEGTSEIIYPENDYTQTDENDYIYLTGENDSQTVLYISSYKNVQMPTTLDGKPLTTVGYETFYETDVERVIIPEGVTTIE